MQKKRPAEQPGNEMTAVVPYKPPVLTRGLIKGVEISAKTMSAVRAACRAIAKGIRNCTEAVISERKTGDSLQEIPEIHPATKIINMIRKGIHNAIYKTVKFSRDSARSLRLVERINLHAAPKLLDDEHADILLKSDIIDDLDSRTGIFLPFMEEIERLGRVCFDHGIRAERLIDFLESDEVMEFLIDEVLGYSHSRYRGSNAKAAVASIIDTIIYKLEHFAQRKKKKPVDETVAKDLRKKIAYFKDKYDPRDKTYTVANFVQALQGYHNSYDVLTWLEENKKLLIEILRGRSQAKDDDDTQPKNNPRHVANIVDEVYEERGQINPQQFMRLHLKDFIRYYDASDNDVPAFLRRQFREGDSSGQIICVLDLQEISLFFDEVLPRIQTPQTNLISLRKIIIDICVEELGNRTRPLTKIVIKDKNNEYTVYGITDSSKLQADLEEQINASCQVISSHVDVRNLLIDPQGIPHELKQNHQDWFDADGNLKIGPYSRYLRGIFGHTRNNFGRGRRYERGHREEFERVRGRVSDILQSVNDYLASVSHDLKIPPVTMERVRDINDYAELVKIACTSKDAKERFAARRKIELAILAYSCIITPRRVYQDHEAGAVKRVLESSGKGLKIRKDDKKVVVEFLDYPDGRTRKVFEDDGINEEAEVAQFRARKKGITLIPAKFAEIDCFVLPASGENGGAIDDSREYMGRKSLFSMLTNLLNEDNKRAKDISDLLRMTFVVDSIEELIALQQHLENNYISFGRTLKRENRYGRFVRVQSFNTSESAAKSKDYRTLRYVVDIPIQDEAKKRIYAVPVEIRILLTEDIIRERSEFNDASHKKYEERRLQKALHKIAPPELFPEAYKTVGPHPDDIFERAEFVPKSSTDYLEGA